MRDAPPVIPVQAGRGVIFLWLAIAAALAGAVALFFFNPSRYPFYPRCFFKMVTGLDCPGCGGLRATHQLLHGHLSEAFALNPLFVLSLPLVAYFSARALLEKVTGRKWRRIVEMSTSVWICAAIVIAFGVLRNLPWRAWLGV